MTFDTMDDSSAASTLGSLSILSTESASHAVACAPSTFSPPETETIQKQITPSSRLQKTKHRVVTLLKKMFSKNYRKNRKSLAITPAFPRFRELPAEIREKIWRMAIPERRVIYIKTRCLHPRGSYCGCNMIDDPRTIHILQNIPPLLHTNFEARQVTASHWGRMEGPVFDKQGAFFNGSDVLFFREFVHFASIGRQMYRITQHRRLGLPPGHEHDVIVNIQNTERLLTSIEVLAVGFTEAGAPFVGAMLPQFTSLKALIVPEPAYVRPSKIIHKRHKITECVLQMFQEYYEDMHGKRAEDMPKIYFMKRHAFEAMRDDTKIGSWHFCDTHMNVSILTDGTTNLPVCK